MATFDLAVRGGTVVTSRGRGPLDIYVRDERIGLLASRNDQHRASHVVDANDLLVLPGMVDTHVHLMDPGDASREDFPTGTTAAACAGVTTIVEHTHSWPVTTSDRLAEKLAHLNGRSFVDYGLAAHIWPDQMDQLQLLWHSGVAFFKIFTCHTHGIPAIDAGLLHEVMNVIRDLDAACLVHCEDDAITRHAERVLRNAKRDDAGLLIDWRSREAELVATATVNIMARTTGARVTIAHVSMPESLALMTAAVPGRGHTPVAETCPQYLWLHESDLLDHGAFRKFTPPARIRSSDDEDAMWRAFNRGSVNHISSDHAPSTAEQKRTHGIWDAHFGLPGIDTTLPLMLTAALTGRTSLERVVAAYAEAPAQHYRLRGKGRMEVGADADLILVDPNARWILRDDDILSRAGWTPYAGSDMRGKVVATILRGRVIARDRQVQESLGRFLPGPGMSMGRP